MIQIDAFKRKRTDNTSFDTEYINLDADYYVDSNACLQLEVSIEDEEDFEFKYDALIQTKVTSISFANKLTEIPRRIFRLTTLTQLDLNYKELTRLPPEIGLLTSLMTLTLMNNQLTRLPPEIGRLTSLEFLNVAHNKLTCLPAEIGRMTSLEIVCLSHNNLTSLPPELRNLTKLRLLEVDNNFLLTHV